MAIFYPNSGALANAADQQTALAASKIRLFDETLVPTVATTRTELLAAESAFSGYPAGGKAIAAFNNPLLDPAGGASIESPLVQFEGDAGPPQTPGVVGGFWIEDATAPTPVVRVIGTFPAPIPVDGPGTGIPITVKLISSNGQVV